MSARYDLRAAVEALAEKWKREDDTTQWGSHEKSRCASALRDLLAERPAPEPPSEHEVTAEELARCYYEALGWDWDDVDDDDRAANAEDFAAILARYDVRRRP